MPRADVEAARLLKGAGISSPPVDVYRLARNAGATIVQERLDPEVSGVLYRRPEGVVIAVNKEHALTRRRFTVAHELGHLLLHQGRPLIVDHLVRARINFRDHRSSLATEREEIDANRFAANILMPADMIHACVTNELANQMDEDRTIRSLAHKFSVSPEAMEFRLINLGLRAAI